MCLLPVTDHPTHRRTDKPSYRDAWTLDTSKNEWRWGYFINIKQKTEDNTETLFTAKILALTSIFEGFYARYRATSINRGWIWSDMHGQIMLQMACTDVALNYCMKNMLDVPIIRSITPNALKMLIQGPVAPVYRISYVILMPIFGFPTIDLVYEACRQQCYNHFLAITSFTSFICILAHSRLIKMNA